MSEEEVVKLQKEKEETEKSLKSWKTWGIISIIGTVFFFIVAVLLLIFIFKYRHQLSNCASNLGSAITADINKTAKYVASKTEPKLLGGCGCDVAGGCGCDMTGGCGACAVGGCGCDMTGGAANSSSFLNKLLKKK